MATSEQFYVGFEGPIAAGKTTLAGLLATHTKARLVLEEVDGNEFLADFYSARDRWSLPMQLWFLTARHQQLNAIAAQHHSKVVADYTFAKDGIFARTLLKDREIRLYDRIASGLKALPQPHVFVYLDADDDVLLERIKRRNRPYESTITKGYLDSLRTAYEAYLTAGSESNICQIDTTHLNLNSDSELHSLFASLLSKIPDA